MLSAVTLLAGVAAQAGASAAGAVADPGALDPAFGGASHGRVVLPGVDIAGVAVQPHGGIVVVGDDGSAPVAIRLRADGTRDTKFATGTIFAGTSGPVVSAVACQPDGKVVITGTVHTPVGTLDVGVWRLTASGRPDPSFGGGDGFVQLDAGGPFDESAAIALDSEGRIIVAGTTDPALGNNVMAVTRFTADGAPDPSFNAGESSLLISVSANGSDRALALAVQPDDRIVMTGGVASALGLPVLRVVPGSLTTAAALDPDFGGGDGKVDVTTVPDSVGYGAAIAPHGRILLMGEIEAPAGGLAEGAVVRLTPAGDLDPTYGGGSALGPGVALLRRDNTDLFPAALTMLSAGGVAVVGFTATKGARGFLAKLKPSGAPDVRVGSGGIEILPGHDELLAAAAQPDGRIIAVGSNPAETEGAVYRFLGDLEPALCAGKKATITGTKSPDRLVGTEKPDVIAGVGGSDRITGLGKGDIVCGGAGNDHIAGGRGGDHLYGGTGRDTLLGGQGVDSLVGGPGRDTLRQ